jgi:hypothetical protein
VSVVNNLGCCPPSSLVYLFPSSLTTIRGRLWWERAKYVMQHNHCTHTLSLFRIFAYPLSPPLSLPRPGLVQPPSMWDFTIELCTPTPFTGLPGCRLLNYLSYNDPLASTRTRSPHVDSCQAVAASLHSVRVLSECARLVCFENAPWPCRAVFSKGSALNRWGTSAGTRGTPPAPPPTGWA